MRIHDLLIQCVINDFEVKLQSKITILNHLVEKIVNYFVLIRTWLLIFLFVSLKSRMKQRPSVISIFYRYLLTASFQITRIAVSRLRYQKICYDFLNINKKSSYTFTSKSTYYKSNLNSSLI